MKTKSPFFKKAAIICLLSLGVFASNAQTITFSGGRNFAIASSFFQTPCGAASGMVIGSPGMSDGPSMLITISPAVTSITIPATSIGSGGLERHEFDAIGTSEVVTVSSSCWTVIGNVVEATATQDHGLVTVSSTTPFTQVRITAQSSSTAVFSTEPALYTTLPVDLIAFTAEPLGNKDALLQWTTASEINNSHFDVELSYDGRTFEVVGDVAGNGNSQHQIDYSYTDASVSKVEKTVYYRLKQVDFDGSTEYSDIRVVRFDAVGNDMQLFAYPNPLNNELNVMVGLSNGESYQLEVTNLQGKLVHLENHTYDNGLHKLNTSAWNSGMYIVRVATEHATKHMKVVKK